MGFGVPIDAWLRGPLRDWAEDLLDERRLRQAGFPRCRAVRQAGPNTLSGKRNWQYRLWPRPDVRGLARGAGPVVSGATAGARLRVLFALPYLAKDEGAERVMVTLLTHLDRQHFEPMFVVQDAARDEIADPLPPDVIVDLGLARARRPGRRCRCAPPDVLLDIGTDLVVADLPLPATPALPAESQPRSCSTKVR